MARKPAAKSRASSGAGGGSAKKFAYDAASMRIVVLVSDDGFLTREYTKRIADGLREQFEEIEEFAYDGDSAMLADVLDELRSYGLIQRHKLVILDNADKFLKDSKDGEDEEEDGPARSGYRQAMERYAASPVDHATLVMRATGWRPGKIDKLIAKVGFVFKATAPTEAVAVNWVIARALKRYEVEIAKDAAALLVSQIGADLGRLDFEVSKLAAYVGEGGTITREVVGEMVGLSREEKVWVIQSAIASGNPAAAFRKLQELMDVSRQHEVLISWAIMDLMKKIHAASRLLARGTAPFTVARELRLFGDAQEAILGAAKRLSVDDAAGLLDRAVKTDQNNKSGVGDPVRSLEALTLEIADTIAGAGSRAAGARGR